MIQTIPTMNNQKHLFGVLFMLLLSCSAFGQDNSKAGLRLVAFGDVFFHFAIDTIRGKDEPVLDGLAEQAAALNDYQFDIYAHTDNIGTYEKNLRLSTIRANRVKSYLVNKGVDSTRIKILGLGERQPLDTNKSSEGRSRNRRATINLYEVVGVTVITQNVSPSKTTKKELPKKQTQQEPAENNNEVKKVVDTIKVEVEKVKRDTVVVVKTIIDTVKSVIAIDGSTRLQDIKDANLSQADVGEIFLLENLYFEPNDSVLVKSSQEELNRLVDFMAKNKNMAVEIGGHINLPGEPATIDDWELSEARARLVYNYLLKRDIEAERMSYKGYANTKMLYPNPVNEKEEDMNMRVDVKILSIK